MIGIDRTEMIPLVMLFSHREFYDQEYKNEGFWMRNRPNNTTITDWGPWLRWCALEGYTAAETKKTYTIVHFLFEMYGRVPNARECVDFMAEYRIFHGVLANGD